MGLEREMEDLRKQVSIREAALGELALEASHVPPAQRLEIEILKTLRQDLADRELEVCHLHSSTCTTYTGFDVWTL